MAVQRGTKAYPSSAAPYPPRFALKLSRPASARCPQCHKMKLIHHACKNCGYYDGKKVLRRRKNRN